MLGQELGKIEGFPLKMVMETTMTDKKGREQKATTTMEVTALRQESVAGDRFVWPDHYTETEVLPDLEQGIQQQMKDAKKQKKAAEAKKKREAEATNPEQDAREEERAAQTEKEGDADEETEGKKVRKGLLRGVLDRLP
jgi:hypothetical protein